MAGVAQAKLSSAAPFELKSASLSAVALVLRTADVAALSAAMDAQFGGSPGLFSHDPVVIDLAHVGGGALDFDPLLALLRAHKMLPVAARGGTPEQMEAAMAAGLSEAPAVLAEPMPSASTQPPPAPTPAAVELELAPAVHAPPAYVPTLVIHKPLRSGQQVYAKNGDLIVMAAVNFGAEVLADGNIHVYGPLRGKAVAGAKGNSDARIFSTCMEPELVSIAGTYRTTDNPLPGEVVGKPAQIRLAEGRLLFEPLL